MSDKTESFKYQLRITSKYKAHLKKVAKRNLDDVRLIKEVVDTLQRGEVLDAKYKDHELIGNRAGERECHVKPNLLLVYRIYDGVLILELVDTGTHKDVFPEKY